MGCAEILLGRAHGIGGVRKIREGFVDARLVFSVRLCGSLLQSFFGFGQDPLGIVQGLVRCIDGTLGAIGTRLSFGSCIRCRIGLGIF